MFVKVNDNEQLLVTTQNKSLSACKQCSSAAQSNISVASSAKQNYLQISQKCASLKEVNCIIFIIYGRNRE